MGDKNTEYCSKFLRLNKDQRESVIVFAASLALSAPKPQQKPERDPDPQ